MKWFSSAIPAPPLSTRLTAIALAFVVVLFVPTTRTCRQGLKIREDQEVLHVVCPEPAFDVACMASTAYFAPNNAAVLCRTPLHRPVRILDDAKRQRDVCDSTFGWLANYDPERGCFCDYYSTLKHGVCVMTEETCRELYGSGATARNNEFGYPDQCDKPVSQPEAEGVE